MDFLAPFVAGVLSILLLRITWHLAGRINLIDEVRSGLKILPVRHSAYVRSNRTKEINRTAHWLSHVGVQKGSIVAVMLDNCAELIIIWMACLKIGSAPALVNPNTKGESLIHVINSAGPVCFIFAEKYSEEVLSVCPKVSSDVHMFVVGAPEKGDGIFKRMDVQHESILEPDPQARRDAKVSDTAVLIYTSGTTGKPKPATITHARLCFAGIYFSSFANLTSLDRIYTCIPLYHSNAAMIGWGTCMWLGTTMVIAPRFSSSKFMEECAEYNVTVIQYVGELARFLLSSPASTYDTAHNIRIAMGNGLRPDVWLDFKKRFAIPEICEFYASTEGNANIINRQVGMSEGVGAVARMGPLIKLFTQIYLVKYDYASEMPLRDAKGHCILCKPGEVGELIAQVSKTSIIKDFKGYHNNAEATSKKILTDVFRPGDKYFRTGDLLMMDHRLYFYFVDRIGDSFRWRGENVSTFEVAETLNRFPGISEANVYGVSVPGVEGRAGMAALKVDQFAPEDLAEFLSQRLPKFAIPVWIRILEETDSVYTVTFKQRKLEYRSEGFNPSLVKNPIFWIKPGETKYSPFGEKEYLEVCSGKVF
ncbi:Fatty-acid-CoA ligase FadD6 [Entophlyctis luteolus]|nr:Fatty-acid-CoA ligase FadD6 [Entophlyctis luteolus]